MPDIVAGDEAAIECAADEEKDGVGLSAAAAADEAFKSFLLAMAEQNHERAARVGISAALCKWSWSAERRANGRRAVKE